MNYCEVIVKYCVCNREPLNEKELLGTLKSFQETSTFAKCIVK